MAEHEITTLVLECLPFVKRLAASRAKLLPPHIALDDLVQAGTVALLESAETFDPSRNEASFWTYAEHRVRGAIVDFLRSLDWLSRHSRLVHKRAQIAVRDLTNGLQRNPTEAEVAREIGMDIDRWRGLNRLLYAGRPLSLATGEGMRAMDIVDPRGDPESLCARGQIRKTVSAAMAVLTERERMVVSASYFEETTLKEIGQALGVNESRVSQIRSKALGKMRDALSTSPRPLATRRR